MSLLKDRAVHVVIRDGYDNIFGVYERIEGVKEDILRVLRQEVYFNESEIFVQYTGSEILVYEGDLLLDNYSVERVKLK